MATARGWSQSWSVQACIWLAQAAQISQPSQSLVGRAGRYRAAQVRAIAASLAHKAGREMKDIQALLRHASYGVTANTYTDVFEDVELATAEVMVAVVPRLRAVGQSGNCRSHAGPTGPARTPHPPEVSSVPAGQRRVWCLASGH